MADMEKRISAVLELDSGTFNNSLKNVNNQIKMTSTELKTASNSVKEFGNTQSNLVSKQKALENSIKSINDKMKIYQDQVGKNTEKMNANKTELTALGNKKDELNKKMVETAKTVGKESDEYKELQAELKTVTSDYSKKEKQITNNINAINKHNVEIAKSESELVSLQGELKRTNKEIENNSNKFLSASKSMESASGKMKAVGSSVSDAGGKIMALSAPIVGAGVAMGVMAQEFSAGMATINTLLDDTTNLEGYKQSVIELSNELNISTSVMQDGLYGTISAIGDMGEETEEIFEVMARSAKAGGAEVNATSGAISATMKGFGEVSAESAGKVSNLLHATVRDGVTTLSELSSSIGQVTPLASALGMSMEDMFTVVSTSTGVVGNTSEVMTKFKSLMESMIRPSKEMTELMSKYGYESGNAMIQAEGMTGVLEILKNETGGNAEALSKLFSSSEALTLALSLTGAQYDTFASKSASMNNSLGLTDKMLEKVQNTAGEKFSNSMNKLKNSFLEAGGSMAPIIEKMADGITSVADAISEMDAETILSVVKLGAMAMAVGGVTKVTGGLISGLGSITGGLGKMAGKIATTNVATKTLGTTTQVASKSVGVMSTGVAGLSSVLLPVGIALATVTAGIKLHNTQQDLMSKTVNTTTEDLKWLEKALNKMNGSTIKSKDEMVNMGLAYKEFGEGISTEFQTKVEENGKALQDFGFYMNEINFDNVLSEDELKNFDAKVNGLVQGTIDTINSRKEETQKSMKDMFLDDSVISETEQKTLDFLAKNFSTQVTETNALKDEINKIKAVAIEEGRILNEQELALVQEKLTRIKQIELEALGASQEEQIFAKSEFNARANNLDIESASTLLSEKAKIRDEEKIQIQASYDTNIEMMKIALETATGEEKTALEAQILASTTARDDKLRVQDELYASYLDIINSKNPELLGAINKYNGEVLTQEDIKAQERLAKMSGSYEDMGKVTESGLYTMKVKNSDAWNTMAIDVDSATGDIIGMYNIYSEKAGGYTKNINDSVKNMGKAYTSEDIIIANALQNMGSSTVTASGEIVGANGKTIASMKDVEKSVDGTRKGVLNLNGEKVKVEVNKDNTIKNLDSILKELDKIKSKTIDIHTNYTSSGTKPQNNATGTNYSSEGLSYLHERGWELSSQPVSTWDVNGQEMGYLQRGTSIKTHSTSIKEMNRSINNAVNSRMSGIGNYSAKEIGTEVAKAMVNSELTVKNPSIVTFLNTLGNQISTDINKIEMSPHIDLSGVLNGVVIEGKINDKVLMKTIVPQLDKELYKFNNRRTV